MATNQFLLMYFSFSFFLCYGKSHFTRILSSYRHPVLCPLHTFIMYACHHVWHTYCSMFVYFVTAHTHMCLLLLLLSFVLNSTNQIAWQLPTPPRLLTTDHETPQLHNNNTYKHVLYTPTSSHRRAWRKRSVQVWYRWWEYARPARAQRLAPSGSRRSRKVGNVCVAAMLLSNFSPPNRTPHTLHKPNVGKQLSLWSARALWASLTAARSEVNQSRPTSLLKSISGAYGKLTRHTTCVLLILLYIHVL